MKYELNPPDHFAMPQSSPLYAVTWAHGPKRRFETHLACEADLGIGVRRYLLRIWNNFLYFTESPQEPTRPVWSLLDPVANTADEALKWMNRPEELLSWWQAEVHTDRFGILVGGRQNLPDEDAYIWGCHGLGDVRPWWDDRPGEKFRWPAGEWNSAASLLSSTVNEEIADLWNARADVLDKSTNSYRWAAMSAGEKAIWEASGLLPTPSLSPQRLIEAREILSRHRQDMPLQWSRGNFEEAKALASAIVSLDLETWEHTKDLHCSLNSVTPSPTFIPFWGFYEHIDYFDPYYDPELYPKGTIAKILLILLQREYDPIGWRWKENDSPEKESEICTVNHSKWLLTSFNCVWSLSEPTHHERLESMLLLRDWLTRLMDSGTITAEDQETLFDVSRQLTEPESKALRKRFMGHWDQFVY